MNNGSERDISPTQLLKGLCCPVCKSTLSPKEQNLQCINTECNKLFPLVDGIPILINEGNSLFSIKDFLVKKRTTFKPSTRLERIASRFLPQISVNLRARTNFTRLAQLLTTSTDKSRILVIGGSVLGEGLEVLESNPNVELIDSDVAFGPRTKLISDAHDIPFQDNSLDGIVLQAVLDDLTDPFRCVNEVYRVLKPDGLVYAETPFMQQVHNGRFDFLRFSHLAHRRLFRRFDEIASGPVCGPGMALAWSCQYFLLCFFKHRLWSHLAKVLVRLTCFWLKYFDYFLIDRPGTYDAASGFYFLGRKSNTMISDRELIKIYRGAQYGEEN